MIDRNYADTGIKLILAQAYAEAIQEITQDEAWELFPGEHTDADLSRLRYLDKTADVELTVRWGSDE
jgi:hypothetical protein